MPLHIRCGERLSQMPRLSHPSLLLPLSLPLFLVLPLSFPLSLLLCLLCLLLCLLMCLLLCLLPLSNARCRTGEAARPRGREGEGEGEGEGEAERRGFRGSGGMSVGEKGNLTSESRATEPDAVSSRVLVLPPPPPVLFLKLTMMFLSWARSSALTVSRRPQRFVHARSIWFRVIDIKSAHAQTTLGIGGSRK